MRINPKASDNKPHGFTIVELVIVVIGILAALTLVVCIGVNQRAIGASLQSAQNLSN